MKSEEEIAEWRDINEEMKAPYQSLLLDQLLDSELKDIRDKVNQQNPEFISMLANKDKKVVRGAESILKYLQFEEFRLRKMSEREKLIYRNGVILGRDATLNWILEDYDSMFKWDLF